MFALMERGATVITLPLDDAGELCTRVGSQTHNPARQGGSRLKTSVIPYLLEDIVRL